jgi:hypothetical protein
VVRAVPLADLTMSGLGGGVWANLKVDDSKFPPVEAIKQAKLWKNEDLYKTTVWGWLCEEAAWPAPASGNTLITDVGEVYSLDVRHGGREEKLLVGGLGPLLVSRTMAAMVVCEIESGWPEELAHVINNCHKQRSGVKLAIWGTTDAIDVIVKGPLLALLAPGGQLQGYKTRTLDVYLPRDDPLPGRPSGWTNVRRSVVLVSPGSFRSCPSYVVSHQPWTASLIVHMKNVLDLPRLVLSSAREGLKAWQCGTRKFTPIRSNHDAWSHEFSSLFES